MSVSLRLSRGGSKKRPFFRIVAADIRAPRDGRYIERLGTYNPMRERDDPERINLNVERIKYWLSVGAKPTDRVNGFLAKEGLTDKKPVPEQTKQHKPKKKTVEKLKAKEEKLKAKEEMEKAAENAPKENVVVENSSETSPPVAEKSVEEPTQPAETKPAETSPPAAEKSVEEPTQPEKTKPAETSPPAAEKSVEEPTQPEETKPAETAMKEKKTDEDSK